MISAGALRLSLFLLYIIGCHGSPIDFLLLDDYIDDEPQISNNNNNNNGQDFDVHYDQRQNGTGNFRLHIDGVVIAAPSSAGAGEMVGSLASNYLLNIVEQAQKDDTDDDDDDNDNDKYDENDDKPPYEFEGIDTTSTSIKPSDLSKPQANTNDDEFNEPVAVISSQQIVQITPATPDADKVDANRTQQPDYLAKNVHRVKRPWSHKKRQNVPRRRNKLMYRLKNLFEYFSGARGARGEWKGHTNELAASIGPFFF